MITKRLASVFAHCYSCSAVPAIPPLDVTLSTQLGNASPLPFDNQFHRFLNLTWWHVVSVLRCSFPEQQGDVWCDVHGGGTSFLRPPGVADVGVRTVGSLYSRCTFSPHATLSAKSDSFFYLILIHWWPRVKCVFRKLNRPAFLPEVFSDELS